MDRERERQVGRYGGGGGGGAGVGGGGDRYRERKGVRETEKHEGSEGVNIDGFDPTHAVARL